MAKRRGTFDYLEHYTYYIPGIGEMFGLLALLFLGAILGNVVSAVFCVVMGASGMEYSMLISYPVMFIPPMLYASSKSRANSFSLPGVKVDSSNFAPLHGWTCALMVMVATISLSFCSDAITEMMPPMPEWLENLMSSMTEGKLWVDFLCVSIFAPVFEEWLCRGMVLRGLLHNGKMSAGWAIVISAAFFAAIHANPWQAEPAFILGSLFGYVYYKTGSLKLTMLMHFTNNTLALVLTSLPMFEDAESWQDVMPGNIYWIVFACCILVIALVINSFRKIQLNWPQSNCDHVPGAFDDSRE